MRAADAPWQIRCCPYRPALEALLILVVLYGEAERRAIGSARAWVRSALAGIRIRHQVPRRGRWPHDIALIGRGFALDIAAYKVRLGARL